MTSPDGDDDTPAVATGPALAAAVVGVAQYLSPMINFLRSDSWQRFTDGFRRFVEHPAWGLVAGLIERAYSLPPNLETIRTLTLVGTERLALEGITIYRVPRTSTARRLLLAETRQARRQILGQAFASILDDCEGVLAQCDSEPTEQSVVMVRRAIAAARDGHTEAAQALGANIVDSLLVHAYGWRPSRDLTNHKKTTSETLRAQYAVAQYMVLAPIHASYMTYWGGTEPVPRAFSRNATAHHAVPRQFSKRNVAQVLMQATSLIALLNDEKDESAQGQSVLR